MEVAHRLVSLGVLFVLIAIFMDDSVCARRLLERQLPVMSHLPEIIPTLSKPEFPIIPKVGFPPIKELPGFPEIGWPELPKGPESREVPKCLEKPQEPQVHEQPIIPELPHHPEPEEPKVPENQKLPEEPEVPKLPHPIVPEKPKEPDEPLSDRPPKELNYLEIPWRLGRPVLPSSMAPPVKIENSPPVTAAGAP